MTEEMQADEPEVQNDHVTDDQNNGDAEPSVNQEPDSSTGQEEKVTFDERQQAIFNKAIAEKVAKQREAEREAQEVKKRLAELEAQQPKTEEPTIPPMPDAWDDDYEDKVAARDEAILAKARYDAKQEAEREIQQRAAYQQQQAQQQELAKKVEVYTERANSYGITPEDAEKDANTLMQFGINPEVGQYIFNEDKGPLITSFLAKNPMELEALNGMSATEAAVHIATQIKPRAESARKSTKAPPPADIAGGGNVPPAEKLRKGYTIE